MQEGAFFDGETVLEEVGDEGGEVFPAGGGEEAQMAEVDANYGRECWGVLGSAGGEELDGGEQGAVATDGEEVVEAVDTVAIPDDLRGDARMLELGAKVIEGRKVGRIDMTVIEGDFHKLEIEN